MSGHAICKDAIALYYEKDELEARGMSLELDEAGARRLVREALESEGAAFWPEMEVDIFASSQALLLIARPPRPDPICFSFCDSEDLIHAACACGDFPDSALLYLSGRYYLLIHTLELRELAPFFEFGHLESEKPEAWLLEHGECIITQGAIPLLRKSFL